MDKNTYVSCTNCIHGGRLFKSIVECDNNLYPHECNKCNPYDPEDSCRYEERPNYTNSNLQAEYWNEIFKSMKDDKIEYDLWLDKYKSLLMTSKDVPIIDLGCGSGNDTSYLKERGYKVISCDFSVEALKRLDRLLNGADIRCFDMQEGLPFEDNSAKVVISDLSLHYFNWNSMQKILKEINRVLMDEGVLLCRVNSANDINYGAGKGLKIEGNFYNIDGRFKRFFNEDQLNELFKEWKNVYMNKEEVHRYKVNNNKMNKFTWEVSAQKTLIL